MALAIREHRRIENRGRDYRPSCRPHRRSRRPTPGRPPQVAATSTGRRLLACRERWTRAPHVQNRSSSHIRLESSCRRHHQAGRNRDVQTQGPKAGRASPARGACPGLVEARLRLAASRNRGPSTDADWLLPCRELASWGLGRGLSGSHALSCADEAQLGRSCGSARPRNAFSYASE